MVLTIRSWSQLVALSVSSSDISSDISSVSSSDISSEHAPSSYFVCKITTFSANSSIFTKKFIILLAFFFVFDKNVVYLCELRAFSSKCLFSGT